MLTHKKYSINYRHAALALSMLLLGACAGLGTSPHYVLSPKGVCCESFDQMAFKALPADKKVRLSVDGEDPGFRFKGGFSRFEALALPDFSAPYILQLESEVVRSSEDHRGGIFYPVLTFLDDKKQKIETYDDLPYTLQTPFYGRNHIRASIKIIGDLANAKYVVVHTQDNKLNHALSTGDGKSTLQSNSFKTMLYAPVTKSRYRINFTENGWLRVMAFAE